MHAVIISECGEVATQSCYPSQAASIRVDKPQAPVVGTFDTIGEQSLQLFAGPWCIHATYMAAACPLLLCVVCCSRRADTVTLVTCVTNSKPSDVTLSTSSRQTGEDVQSGCRPRLKVDVDSISAKSAADA